MNKIIFALSVFLTIKSYANCNIEVPEVLLINDIDHFHHSEKVRNLKTDCADKDLKRFISKINGFQGKIPIKVFNKFLEDLDINLSSTHKHFTVKKISEVIDKYLTKRKFVIIKNKVNLILKKR